MGPCRYRCAGPGGSAKKRVEGHPFSRQRLLRYFFKNLLKSETPPPMPPRLRMPPGADRVRLVVASRYLVLSSSGTVLYW
jgi:hypothetical protein